MRATPFIRTASGIKALIAQVHDVINDPIWIALGQPKAQRIYISQQDDFWDMIAIRVYGEKRGNEHLMYRLLESNYKLREVVRFPAGLSVITPSVTVSTEIPLVPWKSTTVLPS